jgi:hypothetical protein
MQPASNTECMVRPVFARSLGDSAIEPAEMYPAYLWSSTLLALMESAHHLPNKIYGL